MTGITLGGGVGISAHCSVRIVTESSQVGMPETAIGLCPDVGGLYLLSRAPGELGTHAALTGARFGPADAIHAGLADHFVPAAELGGADRATAGRGRCRTSATDAGHRPASWPGSGPGSTSVTPATTSRRSSQRCGPRRRPARRAAAAGAGSDVADGVEGHPAGHPAGGVADPGRGAGQDFRVGSRFLRHPDLAEGIRAQIIDKDRRPRWNPATLDQVTDADVAAFFEPLDSRCWCQPVVRQDARVTIRSAARNHCRGRGRNHRRCRPSSSGIDIGDAEHPDQDDHPRRPAVRRAAVERSCSSTAASTTRSGRSIDLLPACTISDPTVDVAVDRDRRRCIVRRCPGRTACRGTAPRSSVTGMDTAPDARIRRAAAITVSNWSMPGAAVTSADGPSDGAIRPRLRPSAPNGSIISDLRTALQTDRHRGPGRRVVSADDIPAGVSSRQRQRRSRYAARRWPAQPAIRAIAG